MAGFPDYSSFGSMFCEEIEGQIDALGSDGAKLWSSDKLKDTKPT